MSDDVSYREKLDPEILKSFAPAQVGAALSKLLAASIGDLTVVLSHSPTHKHYSLADIEWMVMPPVTTGQFYVVEMTNKVRGFRVPVAVLTWAFVSEEVDRRLQEQAGRLLRLRPDEWKSGEIAWLIDAVGNPAGVQAGLRWLAAGPFKEQSLKVVLRNSSGPPLIDTLKTLMTACAEAGSSST